MIDLRRLKPLDIALWTAVVAVIMLASFLGWSVWSQNRQVVSATPASRAVEAIQADLKKDPNNLDLRMRLAQALVVAAREREAVAQYQAVLKVNKDYTPALSGLGFIAAKDKEWKTAQGYFQKVTDLLANTENADRNRTLETAYFYLGTAQMEQHDYEDAIGNFKAALRIRRDASDTHYALAYCYKGLDSEKKYREELEAAIAFDPKMPEANYDLALLLIEEGNLGRAAEMLRTSVDAAPGVDKPMDALDKLGPFSERLSSAKSLSTTDAKKALAEARVAASLEPDNVDALQVLATLWEKNKYPDQALSTYRRILLLSPQDSDAKKAVERLSNAS